MSDPGRVKSSYSHVNSNFLEWRKSSHSFSNGNCVEAAGGWVKSSLSFSNGNCVEGALCGRGGALVRDSKDPDGPVLSFSRAAWAAFTGGLKHAEPGSAG